MKALAGSNVSRGFESRPLCVTNYRLDRRFVLRALGFNVSLVGVMMVGFFLFPTGSFGGIACGIAALLLLSNSINLMALPPVVVRTSAAEIRVGGRLTVKRLRLLWTDVEGVERDDARLYLNRGEERILAFPLAYVGGRSDELVRDIYDRLNEANGYTRFDPS